MFFPDPCRRGLRDFRYERHSEIWLPLAQGRDLLPGGTRNSGFQNTFSAEGGVNNLKELILQNFNPSDGKLLYVSGEIISNDLDKQLISEGYNVKRIVNY